MGHGALSQGARQDTYEFFIDAEPKSISHNQTFGTDTVDRDQLDSTLSYLCQKAAKRLRDSGLYTRTITLTLRYAEFKTITRSKTLPEPTNLDSIVLSTIQSLLHSRLGHNPENPPARRRPL